MASVYGFFSQWHLDKNTYDHKSKGWLWRTVDGTIVHATTVRPDEEGASYTWPDKKFCGELVERLSEVL